VLSGVGMRVTLRQRFRDRARRTSPWLLLQFVIATTVLLPIWIPILIVSLLRSYRWRRAAVCRAFMRQHQLAFSTISIDTLTVQPISGGISNCSLLWQCHDTQGEAQEYFVKIFLPLGTLWAWVCPWVSPFPRIYGSRVHERFLVDLATRTLLAERGVSVARLITFDPVQCVMVTTLLHGHMVNDCLDQMVQQGSVREMDRQMLVQCGIELGKAHHAGFSIVDAQPANCMWLPEHHQAYILDLEYSTRDDKRMWDVGFFLAYLTAQVTEPMGSEAKMLFLQGYAKHHAINAAALTETGKLLDEYLPVFETILDLRQYTPEQLFGVLTQNDE
jgi:tRNA A-37 threonylcarbamoyl transferase component Bud32